MMPAMVSRKNQKNSRGRQLQVRAQELRRRQHVQEHAVEGDAAGQRQQQEARVRAQLPVAPHQVAHVERLALGDVQRLGQQLEVGDPQRHAHRR